MDVFMDLSLEGGTGRKEQRCRAPRRHTPSWPSASITVVSSTSTLLFFFPYPLAIRNHATEVIQPTAPTTAFITITCW